MEEQERIVKGIWIPIEIWKDKNLSWNEKLLFLEIDSFTSKDKDCFISDEYISNFLGISPTNANKTLASLIKKGYVVKTRFDGRHRYVKAALSFATTLHCYEQQPLSDDDKIISNNTSTNTITNKKEIEKKEPLDLSIVSEEMMPVVKTWLEYKKEKKQSYKTRGFAIFYKRICEWSGNNPQVAMQMVENSMQNNYDGVFPLKNNRSINGGNKTNTEKFYDTIQSANEFSQKLHERVGNQAEMGKGDSEPLW